MLGPGSGTGDLCQAQLWPRHEAFPCLLSKEGVDTRQKQLGPSACGLSVPSQKEEQMPASDQTPILRPLTRMGLGNHSEPASAQSDGNDPTPSELSGSW